MLICSHSLLSFNDVPAHVVSVWYLNGRMPEILPQHLHGLRQFQGTNQSGVQRPRTRRPTPPSDLVSLFAKGNHHFQFDSCPGLSVTLFSMADTVNSGTDGIMELLEQKDEEIAKLRVRVAELEDMLMKLSEDVRSLTAESELAVSACPLLSQYQERYTTTN